MTTTATAYVDLRVDQIDRNPDQPRKAFDIEKLQELADSIAANGLLEPVIVRPAGDRHLLIAGERRWRASKLAGVETIPARVMEGLDDADAYVLSVAENVNRDDMTVMEESDAFAQLIAHGKTVDDIARLFGKSKTFVETRLSFLDLCDEVRDMVEKGRMGPWLARYVAKLRPGNQRTVATRWARGEFQHETEASEFASALAGAEAEVSIFDMEEPTEEERAVHQRQARAARSQADQIERLSGLLGELAAADPADLATALGNDVYARFQSMDRITRQATQARAVLSKAHAVAQARSMVVHERAQA